MASLIVLANIVGLVALAAYIWLLVVAFKQHVGWGLGVLFLSPIAAIIFAIKYWKESKVPFLAYMGCSTLGLAILIYVMGHLGGFGMIALAKDYQDGTLTDEHAQQYMMETMDRWEDSGLLSAEEQKELQKMREQFMAQTEGGAGDTSRPQTAPGRTFTYGSQPPRPRGRTTDTYALLGATSRPSSAEPAPPIRPRRTHGEIPIREAGDYIGEFVTVKGTDGLEHRGTLAKADGHTLVLEQYMLSGIMAFELRTREVESVEIVRR